MWEMSKFSLTQCFIPVPVSEVCNKKKHHHSLTLLDCIPLFLCSSIWWFRIILALCWHTALCFLSFSDWQVFNHLEITDFCGREKWEPDIPDTLMSPCSGYDFIKAFSNEKMQCSAQATEQHCISSRGHSSLVASGKRSTCCHKVTEK